MANKLDWNPIYIRTVAEDKPKFRVDADYWNALWNSTIEQGDNNAAGVLLLKTEVEFLAEEFTRAMDPSTGIIAAATQQAKLAEGHQIKAEEAATNAERHEVQAAFEALEAQSWARGGTDTRDGEDTDNAKYYSEQIAVVAEDVRAAKDDLLNTVLNEKASIHQIISAAETSISGSVANASASSVAAANSKSEADNAKVAAQVAQAAAEKARDEAQGFVGGDYVTSEDFEEGVKNFVTTSAMEAYVNEIMTVDTGAGV